jgi:hypothetical protein
MEKSRYYYLHLKWKVQEFVGWCLYRLGVKPKYSQGICGNLTSGYGELSENGYWQYPTPRKKEKEDA